jgi:hypothetical protein
MRWLKYIQTAYTAGHPQPHPPRYRAHGSWLTTNYDVLLPLLPKGLIYAMNANPKKTVSSFEIMSIIYKIIVE